MTKASKKAFRSDAQLKHCSMPERCRLQKNTEDNYLMRWELMNMTVEMSEREYKLMKVFQEHPEEFLDSLFKVIKDPCDKDQVPERQAVHQKASA